MANVTSSSQKDKTVQGTLGERPHKNDLILVTDRSDGKGSASGTQKYATVENIMLAATGLQGAAGPQGEQGVQGIQGATGAQGAQGPAGPDGAQGPQGLQGVQGVKGDRGEPGASGAVGTQGPAGGSGAQGNTGPQGATSPAGLTWKGTWVAGDAYQVNDSVGFNGASYFCVVANSDTTNPDSTPNWALLAAQGATGPAGADGAQGPVGPQGPAGPAGPEGEQGVAGPQGVAGVAGSQGAQGAIGLQGPAGADGVQGVAGPAGADGPAGPQGEAGTTVFSELDQIPDNLNPGAYLRVNDSGDGLVNVMTAPPDGGISTNKHVNARNHTGVPIPDRVAFIWNSHYYWLDLSTITEGDKGSIWYHRDIGDNDYMRIAFKNAPGGANVGDSSFINTTSGRSRYYPNGSVTASQSYRDNRTKDYSLEQFVDPSKRPTDDNDEMVYFSGTKSGTSGAGNLNVIKAQRKEFYTELPDAIVATHSGGYECILRLKFAKNATDQTDGRNFYYEARIQSGTASGSNNDYLMVFTDDSNGTFNGHGNETDQFPTDGSMDQNLRWFIENGRALYYGSEPSTSRIGQLEDVRNTIPLASSVEIPDAILGKDNNGNFRLYKFTQARSDRFDYQSNAQGSNYLFAFNSTTGAWTGGSHAVNITKEYDNIQGYISNGRALYYGGTSNAGIGVTKFTGLEDTPATLSADKILKTNSTGDQIILVDDVEITSIDDIADVQTSGTGHDPADGDALVWNQSHGHWMPGGVSSTFAELTDTPSTLDAGSYLRVNSAGDGVEQVKTAPPDGGLGDNSEIQAFSNFDGKLPDQLIDRLDSNTLRVFDLYHLTTSGIYYVHKNGNGYIKFNENGIGVEVETIGGSPQYTSIQEYIDNKQAIFHGEKSGTTGLGNLSVIKNRISQTASGGFYTELPDAIYSQGTLNYDGVYRLHWVYPDSNATGTNWEVIYRAEAFDGPQDYWIGFRLDSDGTNVTASASKSAGISKSENLRWFIENGRALYYGSEPSTSRVGQAQDIRDAVPLASSVELPDAILDHDVGENTSGGDARVLVFEKYNGGHFQYHATNTTNFHVRFDATTGEQVSKAPNSNGDFGSIQEYISNGRALYFGGTSNAGIGVTAFTGLEDTPATLSADKILKTNSTGDQIILVDDVEPKYLAASFTGTPVLNGVQGAVGTNGVASPNQNILDALLDDSLESGVYTYGHDTHGGTALTLSMPLLSAGQQVEIFHYKGSLADKDIQFNGVDIGAVGDGTKRWSSPQTAINGTNTIHLPLTSATGGANALGIFQVKIDGEIYDGMVTQDPVASINDLTDVQTSGTGHDPADGDVLVWNEAHGHWMPGTLFDGGGGSVNDISGLIRHYNLDGNLNDATLTTDLTSTGDALNWEAGKFNQAVKLNGTNNKLNTGLIIPSDSTISFWYKHNDKTGGDNLYIFGDFASSGGNATSSVSLRVVPTNKVNILTSSGVQLETDSSPSVWHHAVLTRSGGAWKFYLDGTEVHSGTAGSASNTLVFAHWTAANISTNFFGGWLDNIRIYNRELSASEVTTLYNQ